MLQSNKYNKLSGIGEPLKFCEYEIYRGKPNGLGQFFDSKGRFLAERIFLDLTQDDIYKTQFRNPDLANAVRELNEYTKIVYYDADGEIENPASFCPTLSAEYASIVCKYEPLKPLTRVSIVVYRGLDSDSFILRDGSLGMNAGYVPKTDADVATKGYVDKVAEDLVASLYPLKTFQIDQSLNVSEAIYYKDNNTYNDILLIDDDTDPFGTYCTLTVDPFAIPLTFSEDTEIAVFINSIARYTVPISDILVGKAANWVLIESEDVYNNKDIKNIYWKNSYAVRFNLQDFDTGYRNGESFMSFEVRILDKNNAYRSSLKKTYGLDTRTKLVEGEAQVQFTEELLNVHKTKWISGKRYFSSDSEKKYRLPVTIKLKNNFLGHFRPENSLTISVIDEVGEALNVYTPVINEHRPFADNLLITQDIEFDIQHNNLRIQAYNICNELVLDIIRPLGVYTDTSDESNRVTTPSATVQYPTINYGEKWDSTKALYTYEMSLSDNVYTIEDPENSVVCFAVEPEGCYSHAKLDIEHDGEMYIQSEGRTGWLSCKDLAIPFTIPVNNEDGCLLHDGHYTFGKVLYSGRLFIRIIKASRVKFLSVELS